MWTLSGMEIQRHPSRYANAAQWLRYSNVSHPGDVEELTQTEQGGGNTEGSGDRTGELLLRQALTHTHIHTDSNEMKQTMILSMCVHSSRLSYLFLHLWSIHTCVYLQAQVQTYRKSLWQNLLNAITLQVDVFCDWPQQPNREQQYSKIPFF